MIEIDKGTNTHHVWIILEAGIVSIDDFREAAERWHQIYPTRRLRLTPPSYVSSPDRPIFY